jgi:hypothetical protein
VLKCTSMEIDLTRFISTLRADTFRLANRPGEFSDFLANHILLQYIVWQFTFRINILFHLFPQNLIPTLIQQTRILLTPPIQLQKDASR